MERAPALIFAVLAVLLGGVVEAYKSSNVFVMNQLKRSFLRLPEASGRVANGRNLLEHNTLSPIPLTGRPAQAPINKNSPPLNNHRRFNPYLYPYRPRQRCSLNEAQRSRLVCPAVKQCQHSNNALDVLFVLDRSGSIGPCDFRKELAFVDALACQLNASATRVGVVSFGSNSRVDVPLCRHDSNCELAHRVRQVHYSGGSTATACGLALANSILEDADAAFGRCVTAASPAPASRSRRSYIDAVGPVTVRLDSGSGSGEEPQENSSQAADGTPSDTNPSNTNLPPARRVFVITDGKSNTGGDPRLEAERLHRRGAEVFALGVTRFVNSRELRAIASPDSCDRSCARAFYPEWSESVICPAGCEQKHVFFLEEFDDFSELSQLFSNDPDLQQNCRQCPRPPTVDRNGVWGNWSEWTPCRQPDMRRCNQHQRIWHTRMRQCERSVCGRPCVGRSLQMKVCYQGVVRCPETPICPHGQALVRCPVDPCLNANCPAHPTAKCVANHCGRCSAVHKIRGMKVDCFAPKRACDSVQCGPGAVCVESGTGSLQCCSIYSRPFSHQGLARHRHGGVMMFPPGRQRKCYPVNRVPGQIRPRK